MLRHVYKYTHASPSQPSAGSFKECEKVRAFDSLDSDLGLLGNEP